MLEDFLEECSIGFTDFFKSVAVRYNALPEAKGLLDYTDQLLWAHRILCYDAKVLIATEGLYDAYFVDEFQDPAPGQFDTLRLLSSQQ